MKKLKTKEPTEYTVKLRKIFTFKLAYFENAQNISQAIELSGYYAKVGKFNGSYEVDIYEQV